MAGTEKFVFTFEDIYGARPDETVSVTARHRELMTSVAHKPKHDTSKTLTITGLDSSHGGTYHVQVFPTRYRPESLFLRVLEDQTVKHTFVLVPDPGRVLRVEFPPYAELGDDLKQVLENSRVEGNEDKKGEALYCDSSEDPGDQHRLQHSSLSPYSRGRGWELSR